MHDHTDAETVTPNEEALHRRRLLGSLWLLLAHVLEETANHFHPGQLEQGLATHVQGKHLRLPSSTFSAKRSALYPLALCSKSCRLCLVDQAVFWLFGRRSSFLAASHIVVAGRASWLSMYHSHRSIQVGTLVLQLVTNKAHSKVHRQLASKMGGMMADTCLCRSGVGLTSSLVRSYLRTR